MAITPTGLPPWGRTTDHTQYGGHTDKRNYQSQGVVNARTDVGAEQVARMAADLAAVARTASFARLRIVMNNAGNPTVSWVVMMTGQRATSYVGTSPPTGFPTVSTVGAGVVSIQFASTYDDPYDVTAALNIVGALPTAADGNPEFASHEIVSASVLRVHNFNASGTATDGTVDVEVWSG